MAVVGTTSLTSSHVVLLLLGGLGAGVVNGVAGGGSLISFPLLLALGYPALTANITNTVGIWPGYVGGAAGFRNEISSQRDRLVPLGAVAALGGIGERSSSSPPHRRPSGTSFPGSCWVPPSSSPFNPC